ncbi:HXXEE domain-containing protein [Methylobacterium nonmethylotrophicum]|uniref:HXXEE domain-containing protein n=1 Tax=Methylobacterium nonmethylotrophicum TaxID=1141884 RepID=A0A4Z0ND34_9HYPH|nr:HXXEE domain-containing protein [Methylobacterium nonmethylotrophicum]TGD91904.1 HXXEE domain-containing protein [Methylobacterium nonmethylotrophicum]
MTLNALSWIAMAAYAFHILEEYQLNWRDWARNALKLPVEWSDFYVTNAVVIALGVAQAMLAIELPLAPMSFAALMLINAIFFHILPFARTRRFSPGLITAVLLFLPCSLAVFSKAHQTGQATVTTMIFSFVIGAVTMAYPIVMLRVRSQSFSTRVPNNPSACGRNYCWQRL